MNIKTVNLVYFSPTRTTKKVLEAIAQPFQVEAVKHLDLTPPGARTQVFEEMHDGLAIIGAPVYGGRLPADAVHRLRRIKGNGTPAAVVVVYGNREYEDALLELSDLALAMGFKPIAGGAFIGEHSLATEAMPIANGRPDNKDLQKAVGFGKAIRKKMRGIVALDDLPPVQVTGNHPYKEWHKSADSSATTQEALCTRCKSCIAVCPTAAITLGETMVTDPTMCILCCACVKNCPTGARVMEHPRVKQSQAWLSTNCRRRKEPETFL